MFLEFQEAHCDQPTRNSLFSWSEREENHFFSVEILLPLPKDWQKVVNEQASDRGGTSGPNSATGSETEQADSSQGSRKGEYVDLLEYSVLYRMFAITDNQAKN